MSGGQHERISVAYGGDEVTDAFTQGQVSTAVWAALRKQAYVSGSQCRVMVQRTLDGMYEIEAIAKEPTRDWQPILDLVIPMNGIEPAEFELFLEEQGLSRFAAPQRGTAIVSMNSAPAVGRNDLCPCGSGKKYKKCCLQ